MAKGVESPQAPLTFDRCEEIALGLLGYNNAEYLDLTPRSLNNAVAGFSEKREAESTELWEIMRTQTATLVNLQLPKNKRVTPKDLFRFPWDRKKVERNLTKEEAKEILAKWQKRA